jgi:hypothetical protein
MVDYRQIIDVMTGAPSETTILRVADQTYIPTDPRNKDYAAYLQWLDEGNTPDPPADEAPA